MKKQNNTRVRDKISVQIVPMVLTSTDAEEDPLIFS